MQFIVINSSTGHVLAMHKGNMALRCKCYWTRERRDVKRFDSGKYAANIAAMVGGCVLSTREASLAGLVAKGAR
jgi:hypothetical protein